MTEEKLRLGVVPNGGTERVTAYWNAAHQAVCLDAWEEFESFRRKMIELSPAQMERLVQWWRENH